MVLVVFVPNEPTEHTAELVLLIDTKIMGAFAKDTGNVTTVGIVKDADTLICNEPNWVRTCPKGTA